MGKRFVVVSGTINFRGQVPPNPTVVAEARWEAPSGYEVYATYTGPAQGGNLSLESNPGLSEGQILGLIATGNPDTTLSTGGDGGGGAAAGIGGGIAATGVNEALRDLTHLDVSASVDTSGNQTTPEVAVQLSPRVRAEVGYNLAEPTPGKNPDRSTLSLEFRIKKHWNLVTTVGDRGSSIVDLIWRYRY
jgi:translocation and assembly module TamB